MLKLIRGSALAVALTVTITAFVTAPASATQATTRSARPAAAGASMAPKLQTHARFNPRLLAVKVITPARGATIHARGATVYVPAHVVAERGLLSMTEVRPGVFDVDIDVKWSGAVRITMPLHSKRDVVLHRLGHTWLSESTAWGQRTVWVTHLSWFSSIASVGAKIASGLCINISGAKILKCMILKGLGAVDKSVAQWIADKIDSSCWTELVAAGLTGGVVGIALQSIQDQCVGQAGEGDTGGGDTGGNTGGNTGGDTGGGSTPPPTPTVTVTKGAPFNATYCTSNYCAHVDVTTAGFPADVNCSITAAYPDTSGFKAWTQGANEANHQTVNIYGYPHQALTVTCVGGGQTAAGTITWY